MIAKLVILNLLFFVHYVADAAGETDPKIYKVIKMTDDADTTNTMPAFRFGRLVFFQGSGPTYGTKCPHIYQFDLATKDISLFSTGLGYESRISIDYNVRDGYPFEIKNVISTANYAFKQLAGDLKDSDFNNDDLCPPSPCDVTPHFDECDKPHFERYADTGFYDMDENGKVLSIEMHETDKVRTPVATLTPCLDVKTSASGNKSIYLCTTSGDNADRAIYSIGQSDEENMITGFASGAFGGFRQIYNTDTEDYDRFFFHGYQLPDPTNADQKKTIEAIRAGIIPRKGSVIFQGTVDGMLNSDHPVWPTKVDGLGSNKDYVFPFTGLNSTQAIVTGYDQTTGASALYSIKFGSTDPPTLLTNSAYNTEFASVDKENKYIVFSSNRDGDGNQLYFGVYPDEKVDHPLFQSIKPNKMKDRLSNYILDLKNYHNNDFDSYYSFKSPSISKDGMLMYISSDIFDTDLYCPQIYQIDPKWNDITVRRKMTSGIHAYESPNFLDDNEILYAATLTKDYINLQTKYHSPSDDLCRIKVCVKDSLGYDKVKDLCKNVNIEKTLSTYSELYISNKYGSIKKRLTINDVYDGEAVVYNSDYVVYTSYDETNKDYNLYQLRLTDTNPEASRKRIVDGYGFEGATTYNKDRTLIAYEAYRPTTDSDKKLYADRLNAGFTDLSKTEIYVYHFDSNKEYQITSFGGRAYSPTFIDSNRISFLSYSTRSSALMLHVAELKCDTTGCTVNGPSILEYYDRNVLNIFYQPDLKSMVVTTKEGVYISNNVLTDKMVVSNPTTVKDIQTTTQLTTDTTDGGNVFGSSALTMSIFLSILFV